MSEQQLGEACSLKSTGRLLMVVGTIVIGLLDNLQTIVQLNHGVSEIQNLIFKLMECNRRREKEMQISFHVEVAQF